MRVKRWLQQHQVDLYWGPDAFLAESPSKTKSVVTIHDLAWEHIRSGMILKWFLDFILNGCLRTVQRADHIISISDLQAMIW